MTRDAGKFSIKSGCALTLQVFSLSAALFFLLPASDAQAIGNGAKGWCTPLGAGVESCFDSPLEACLAQYGYYAPAQQFGGYTDTNFWDSKKCEWTLGLGVIHPTTVNFKCQPSVWWKKLPPGWCVDLREDFQIRNPPEPAGSKACNVAGGNFNNGGSQGPQSGGPVDIITGSKLLRATDFQAADGSLLLERYYSSLSYGGAKIFWNTPLGLGNNWRFWFQHELHINWNFQYVQTVELATADGGAYRFTKSGTGALNATAADYNTKQTDYSLEFVGTWPADSAVLTGVTQWKMRDREDRVWLLETYYDPATTQYGIARPISVTFRGGLQWTFTYGTYNELTAITDSYGKVLLFDWLYRDPSAVLPALPPVAIAVSRATLPDGTTIDYTYDTTITMPPGIDFSDRLIKVEHKNASSIVLDSTSYEYTNTNWPWHLTKIKDFNGTDRWFVEYDGNGRATTSKGPGDADKHTFAYTAPSGATLTRTVTNPLGKETVYNYYSYYGELTSIVGNASANCPASTQTYAYTSSFITSITDAEGRVRQFTRNTLGQPTQIIDGYGTASARTTSITWHSTFKVPTQIVQPTQTTDFSWSTSGQLNSVTQTDTTTHSVPYSTNGQTRIWAYTYDSYGRVLTIDGPLAGTGDTVTFTYDSDGYLATVTNEVAHVLTVSAVDDRGLPTTLVDENSVTIDLTYDSERRLTSVNVDPNTTAATTSIDYDAVGLITKITRPNGAFLIYTWDDGKRLTKVEDNTGDSIEYDRNDFGNITARRIKNSGGTTLLSQTATFDELGRLLTFLGSASQTWTSAYDKTDNLVSVTDPRSNVYQWAFDSLSRLIRETNEESAQVNLTLNGKDQVVNYEDPRSLDTTYVRNGFDDAIQRVSPDTGTTVYEYSKLDKATKITDGRGIVTNLTYDNAGRLLTKEYPAATAENITLTWDSTASGNKGVGRVTKIQDASGSVEWAYNLLGQIAQEKKTTSSRVYTIGYAYDLDGNVTQMTYPSGRIVTFSRDATGRITAVTTKKDSGSATVTLASSGEYHPFGPLKSFTFGNSLVFTRTLTQDYLIDALKAQDTGTSTTVVDRGHAFGDDVNLTGITDNVTPARSETYAYTAANRLQSGAGLWGTLTWGYDGTGNRTSEALTAGGTTTWTYAYPSTSNQLSTVTEGANVRTFTHDGAGNISADDRVGTAYNYRYNNRGRLDRLTIGATVTADYVYDGLERLALRTTQNMTPAGTTHYLYDLAGHLIAEADDTGQTLREYVWLDDLPLAVVADVDTLSPQLWFVHADHLDRPVRMTNNAQAVVWDAVYRPFGEVVSITGSASNNLRFPGQYFLIESGLHYNWHRHYDPTTGRYLQADPGLVDARFSDFRSLSMGQRTLYTVLSQTIPSGVPSVDTQLLDHTDTLSQFSKIGKKGIINLSEFADGANLYSYTRSTPLIRTDRKGLFAGFSNRSTFSSNEQSCRTASLGQSQYCRIVRNACIAQCSETSLPSGNQGWKFFNCVNACMRSHGCDPFAARI